MVLGRNQSIEDDPCRYRKYIDYWTWLQSLDYYVHCNSMYMYQDVELKLQKLDLTVYGSCVGLNQ